ncbi:MAG: hypothetical protein BWY71_00803 [Planctomycetes bacterium ADurb.Bin412]|nr:MAG: hypothetical protein BWY71_00803 [Planctomycetes bacterium ADurb.Bin412]
MGTDGDLAAALQGSQEGSFGGDGGPCGGIIQLLEQGGQVRIVLPDLQGEGALAAGGQELHRVEAFGNMVLHLDAVEAGSGHDQGVGRPFLPFADAGGYIAADIEDLQVRPVVEKLGAAAQGTGQDHGGGGEAD